MTLIEVVVAIGFFTVAFIGLYGLFQASLRYIAVAKARESALSLAVERMESIRAMPYASVGTVQGIPAGTIPQNETITQDGISYNRRTLIQYMDDPADGSGSSDSNGIAADYKRAKVEVSWTTPSGTTSVAMVSNLIPQGLESLGEGGILSALVFDAQGVAVPDATVRIYNALATSTIDIATYTNDAGFIIFPGTPVATGYQITVSKPGYSSAQTYAVSPENPDPDPGHLSIALGQTTTGSFSIDRLASLSVRTWKAVQPATTTDFFANASAIGSAASTTVSGGALILSGPAPYPLQGSAYSTSTAPANLSQWKTLAWSSSLPAGTALAVRLYTHSGGEYTLLPDSALAGNSSGFTQSPVVLSGISTSTYPELFIGASLSTTDPSATPSILDWSLGYAVGPSAFPSAVFTLRSGKTIGMSGSGAAVYKRNISVTTNAIATYTDSAIEWDSYTMSVASTTGWDLAGSCPLQPVAVEPQSNVTADLYLYPHSANSLMVSVRNATSSTAVGGASVTLSRTGFSNVQTTDSCGNAFFSALQSGSAYSITTSAAGYTATTTPNISVAGQSAAIISL